VVKYYSGFCLSGEEELFKAYLDNNNFSISGFSYGAIKAIQEALAIDTRVDRIQLFSPAFFNNKDDKFKRMQMMFFAKDSLKYIENFLQNSSYPSDIDLSYYLKEDGSMELKELLYYTWNQDEIRALIKKGTIIEVYLGQKDKIIDVYAAKEFFIECGCEVYFIKDVGHILS
jgi:hypothetical protein